MTEPLLPCPICETPFQAGDILRGRFGAPGPCHAACIEATPDFDRATGERVIHDMPTFAFGEPTPSLKWWIYIMNRGINLAARSHELRVTEIRNDPKSYKNGKMLRSAKRASDFHERSAQAILALKREVAE